MPERQCRDCRKQAEWGCTARRVKFPAEGELDGPENWQNPAALPVTVGDEESWACPRQDLRENAVWWGRLLLLYAMYRKGFLPDQGAVVDQVNSTLALFAILDDVNAECDRILDEQERARRARNGRGSLV